MNALLQNHSHFQEHILGTLERNLPLIDGDEADITTLSAVLFLIGEKQTVNGASTSPYLILNKRSRQVRQPGDLCFPGGGPAPRMDAAFARLLSLPGFPLARWRSRTNYHPPETSRRLSRLLATCLRESFEEMKVIPLGVRFLGALPPQQLVMFNRTIYPLVGWIPYQTCFWLNWEVEKLVYIPIDTLLDSKQYAVFQMTYPENLPADVDESRKMFPCFIHRWQETTEILWGATYRMVTTFLDQMFNFTPPAEKDRPKITNHLSSNYFSGA